MEFHLEIEMTESRKGQLLLFMLDLVKVSSLGVNFGIIFRKLWII